MSEYQTRLFPAEPALPPGFAYRSELLTAGEEQALVERLRDLPFESFQFQGYVGKRRVVSYGWHYDFNDRILRPAEALPEFLLPVRERAAAFAGLPVERFPHALITEYEAGAGIGWHRDKGVFGEVVGVSLLSACRFRLRRKVGERWERVAVQMEPRSAYLLRGPARSEWEHSIPDSESLRYSITFRTLR